MAVNIGNIGYKTENVLLLFFRKSSSAESYTLKHFRKWIPALKSFFCVQTFLMIRLFQSWRSLGRWATGGGRRRRWVQKLNLFKILSTGGDVTTITHLLILFFRTSHQETSKRSVRRKVSKVHDCETGREKEKVWRDSWEIFHCLHVGCTSS